MLFLKIGIILLGVLAICYAFFGTLYAAHMGEKLKSKIFKKYRAASYLGFVIIILGIFLLIFA